MRVPAAECVTVNRASISPGDASHVQRVCLLTKQLSIIRALRIIDGLGRGLRRDRYRVDAGWPPRTAAIVGCSATAAAAIADPMIPPTARNVRTPSNFRTLTVDVPASG